MKNLEKQRQRRAVLRSKGLCIYCGAVALKGHSYCLDHYLQNTKAARKHSLEHREESAEYMKKFRLKRIEQGLCPKCGTALDPDADAGRIQCVNCRSHLHVRRDKCSL